MNSLSYRCECGGMFRLFKDSSDEYTKEISIGATQTDLMDFHVGRTDFLLNLLLDRVDAHTFAVLAHPLELDLAVAQSEQGVVAALAHVHAGVDVGAALTDQNVAGQNELTVAALHAQTLGLRVAAVPGGANALFMGEKLKVQIQHISYTSSIDMDK